MGKDKTKDTAIDSISKGGNEDGRTSQITTSNSKINGSRKDNNYKDQSNRNHKKKSKGRKYSNDKKRLSGESDKLVLTGKSSDKRVRQDVAWYLKDPLIVLPYAKWPFNTVSGLEIPFSGVKSIAASLTTLGVAVYKFVPTFGLTIPEVYDYEGEPNWDLRSPVSGKRSDALNLASLNLWTFMRSKNSRTSTNYDHQDLMMYLLAVEQLECYMHFLHAIYGSLRGYNFLNRNFPRLILKAYGIDPDSDYALQINNFYGAIKLLEAKAYTYAVPKGFSFYDRHKFLISNIFRDDISPTGCVSICKPAGFFKWNPDIRTGSRLTFECPTKQGNYYTFNDLINFGNSLLDAMINDSDIAEMQSDILRAFQNNPDEFHHYTAIPEDYQTPIVVSPEFLLQLRNMHMLPRLQIGTDKTDVFFTVPFNSSSEKDKIQTEITQNVDQGTLCQYVSYTNTDLNSVVSNTELGVLISSLGSDTTPEEVVEMTRCVSFWANHKVYNSDSYKAFAVTSGSEVFLVSYIVTNDFCKQAWQYLTAWNSTYDVSISFANTKLFQNSSHYGNYFIANTSLTTYPHQILDITHQVDNFTILAVDPFKRLNDGVILNMFNLQNIGIKNMPDNPNS